MYRRHTPLRAGVDRRATAPSGSAGRPGAGRPKVGVVGAGHVGAMTALRLAECDLFSEVAMVDVAPGLAAGLALDIWHGSALGRFDTRLVGSDDPAALAGARFIVVTAGRPRQPGMTRTDLTDVNATVIRSVGESIVANAPDAVVVVVTNPLEEMTHTMAEATGFGDERVIGMAGVLDTARFCSLIGLTGVAAPSDVVALAMGSGAALAGDKVRIGTEGAYPPFNEKNEKGELVGFDVDIAKALCTKMGADCTFVAQDWDGIIPALKAKKYDAIVASIPR